MDETQLTMKMVTSQKDKWSTRIYRNPTMWRFIRWITWIVANLFVFGYVIFVFFMMSIDNSYPKQLSKIGAYVHVVPGTIT